MRIGTGYDVHALVMDRKLIMGGVEIPHHKGLAGHSDADVLTHAVMDALLGAAGLGDIGNMFPDSDPAYEGINSMILLRQVVDLIKDHQYHIEYIDTVIIAQVAHKKIDNNRQNGPDKGYGNIVQQAADEVCHNQTSN